MKPIRKGDYVLASKWHDGDSKDPWVVGFYRETVAHPIMDDRFIVVDSNGKSFRPSGFRRMKRITPARGTWLLANAEEIEASGRSVWGWLRKAMQPKGYLP